MQAIQFKHSIKVIDRYLIRPTCPFLVRKPAETTMTNLAGKCHFLLAKFSLGGKEVKITCS